MRGQVNTIGVEVVANANQKPQDDDANGANSCAQAYPDQRRPDFIGRGQSFQFAESWQLSFDFQGIDPIRLAEEDHLVIYRAVESLVLRGSLGHSILLMSGDSPQYRCKLVF